MTDCAPGPTRRGARSGRLVDRASAVSTVARVVPTRSTVVTAVPARGCGRSSRRKRPTTPEVGAGGLRHARRRQDSVGNGRGRGRVLCTRTDGNESWPFRRGSPSIIMSGVDLSVRIWHLGSVSGRSRTGPGRWAHDWRSCGGRFKVRGQRRRQRGTVLAHGGGLPVVGPASRGRRRTHPRPVNVERTAAIIVEAPGSTTERDLGGQRAVGMRETEPAASTRPMRLAAGRRRPQTTGGSCPLIVRCGPGPQDGNSQRHEDPGDRVNVVTEVNRGFLQQMRQRRKSDVIRYSGSLPHGVDHRATPMRMTATIAKHHERPSARGGDDLAVKRRTKNEPRLAVP